MNLGFSDFDRPFDPDFEAFSYRQSGIPRTELGFDDTYTGEGEPPPWLDDSIDPPLPEWTPPERTKPEIDDTTVPNGYDAQASYSYSPGGDEFWRDKETGEDVRGEGATDPYAPPPGSAARVPGRDRVIPEELLSMGTPAGVERAEG